ncbi:MULTISPECIES: lipocalin-like domain-containing protein [unclassified Sinorhizobium]|uniref:lipocalin-like domain-containing protein n=1 Tax=unclassified Sinorhizobium TaxID=2613772 RepID=UPI0035231980
MSGVWKERVPILRSVPSLRYRVESPNRLVTTVDIAWFEPWVGSEQVRYCDLAGDSLTLTSAPLNMPKQNAPTFAVVTWRREVASQKQTFCGT